jgi:nucleotide-binding universal stress UspA family protein
MAAPRRILVPVDFSVPSATALRAAVAIARASGASLELVHVFPFRRGVYNAAGALVDLYRDGGRGRRRAVDVARRTLEAWRARAARSGVPTRKHFILGRPDEEVCEATADLAADLVVTGTRGFGGARGVMPGSVASELVRAAPAPVLVTRGRLGSLTRALVGDDFSRGSDQALRAVRMLPSGQDLRVLLVHVIDLRPLRYLGGLGFPARTDPSLIEAEKRRALARLEERAARLRRDGFKVECRVIAGEPVRDLARAARAWRAGVIVTATHGLSGVRRFFVGSTTQGLLCSAPCPVLAVKPLDWKSTGS